ARQRVDLAVAQIEEEELLVPLGRDEASAARDGEDGLGRVSPILEQEARELAVGRSRAPVEGEVAHRLVEGARPEPAYGGRPGEPNHLAAQALAPPRLAFERQPPTGGGEGEPEGEGGDAETQWADPGGARRDVSAVCAELAVAEQERRQEGHR